MLLTIAVPTYNRAQNVARLLHQFLAAPASELVEILVIDDGGTDGTYAALSKDPTIAERVRVLKNDVNLGYPRTFARIFAECTTEYVMVIADDDEVVVESVGPLLEYLGRERPAFVSSQFLKGSTVYRGRDVTGPISPKEFLRSSAHAPGLIYRVEDCHAALAELAERTESKQPDALLYPQVILVMRLLVAAAKCEWLALPTVREGSAEPSGIVDAGGRSYWSVESRWQQLKSFDELLTQYVEQDTTGVAQEMRDTQRARVFRTMERAIREESPALGAAFDSEARRSYSTPTIRSRIMSLTIVRWLARGTRWLRKR
ncbi:glycosyltransferase family 2 protein [Microbacterium sp. NPDC055357]